MTITESDITEDMIRNLLREQCPDLADLPLKLGALGWDNQVWRLGDDLAVRLPWATQSADALLRKEHTWVPHLARTFRCEFPSRNASLSPVNASLDPGSSPPGCRASPPTAPRDTARGSGRHPGRLPDRPSPTRPRRGTDGPRPRGPTRRHRRTPHQDPRLGHRPGADSRPGRRPRGLGGRGRRARLDRPAALAPRRPASGQHPDHERHLLRRDRLRRPLRRRPGLRPRRRVDPAAGRRRRPLPRGLPAEPGPRDPSPRPRLGGAASSELPPHRGRRRTRPPRRQAQLGPARPSFAAPPHRISRTVIKPHVGTAMPCRAMRCPSLGSDTPPLHGGPTTRHRRA